VEVDSFVPYEGKLEVRVHEVSTVYVRVPEGVDPAEVKTMLNNREKSPLRDGAYVAFRVSLGRCVDGKCSSKDADNQGNRGRGRIHHQLEGEHDCAHVTQGDVGAALRAGRFLANRAPLGKIEYYVPAQEVAW